MDIAGPSVEPPPEPLSSPQAVPSSAKPARRARPARRGRFMGWVVLSSIDGDGCCDGAVPRPGGPPAAGLGPRRHEPLGDAEAGIGEDGEEGDKDCAREELAVVLLA